MTQKSKLVRLDSKHEDEATILFNEANKLKKIFSSIIEKSK